VNAPSGRFILSAVPLNRSREPFSSPDWIFELKYDGFRAVAEIVHGRCRLVSRNGNAFASFQDLAKRIGGLFPTERVILDGEI
jgi:bifunctional non-homologous end joining protein LigD